MKTSLSNQWERGWTLIELLVVIAIIVFMAMLILPPPKSKDRALRVQCINNLKQNGLAFEVWARNHEDKYPMEISETNGGTKEFITGPNLFRHYQVMSNELVTPWVLICPADMARVRTTNFALLSNSNISFFLGLNASETDPQSVWSGDRSLTNGTPVKNGILELTTNQPPGWTDEMHRRVGNLVLADGSCQQVSQVGLRQAFANSNNATNHLQMPVLTP